jgi:hypothetical protein
VHRFKFSGLIGFSICVIWSAHYAQASPHERERVNSSNTQDLTRATTSLDEVCGGGLELKTHWYTSTGEIITEESDWKDVKRVGESTVVQAFGAAIKKRVATVDTVVEAILGDSFWCCFF